MYIQNYSYVFERKEPARSRGFLKYLDKLLWDNMLIPFLLHTYRQHTANIDHNNTDPFNNRILTAIKKKQLRIPVIEFKDLEDKDPVLTGAGL